MAGITDLVLRAQPRLADVEIKFTEGRTFRVELVDITDAAGDPVDFSAATMVCKVLTDVDGAEVVALDCTGGSGTITITKAATDMAGIAAGATKSKGRSMLWYLKVTSGANVVQFWGPSSSPFLAFAE